MAAEDLSEQFETIIRYAHFWNWSPDWALARDIYESNPNSYSVLTPFAFTYLEELIRSMTSEYGRNLSHDGKLKPHRKTGNPLLRLARRENPENKELLRLLDSVEHYFSQSTPDDTGDNGNSTLHGYMHPRYWSKESFEELIVDIARLSPFAGF